MRDRVTSAIAIVLLAAVTATSYWYAQSLRAPLPSSAGRPGMPDFEAQRLVLTQFDGQGRARHKLFADTMLHFADNDTVELSSPRLVSLLPDQPQLEVVARTGRVENAGERVHLRDNVVVTRAAHGGSPRLQVNTDYLLARPDYDIYETDRPVIVQRGDGRVTARGMHLDNIARTARFEGDVRIVLPPVDARPGLAGDRTPAAEAPGKG
jgi:lipopolysaccharide export system protein LptC